MATCIVITCDGKGNVLGQATVPWPDDMANLDTLRQRAQTALTNNAAYLAIASPTNAQVLAQVAALTRQVDGLLRLFLVQTATIGDS